MTNLEAKQEAIKKAYGEHYDNLKKYLNGFMVDRVNYERETGNKLSDLKGIDFIHEPLVYSYPDVVEGFQNNNGWIRIEREADLPNDEDAIYWALKNGKFVCIELKTPINLKELFSDFLKDKITHYQLIEQPKPPIF